MYHRCLAALLLLLVAVTTDGMYTLHFLDGPTARAHARLHAHQLGYPSTHRYDVADESSHALEFTTYPAELLQDNSTAWGPVVVFHGHDDAPVFRSHLRHPHLINTTGSNAYTAADMARIYQFPTNSTSPAVHPTLGVISLGGNINVTDIHTYWRDVLGLTAFPAVVQVSVDHASYPWGMDPDSDLENMLDIEISGGICHQCHQIVMYSAPNTALGFYDAIFTAIHDTTHHIRALSISWGAPESLFGSVSVLHAYNQLFQQAAAKGMTVFCASGDSGSDDGVGDAHAHVDFPSSSPWVVACGGTTLYCPSGVYSRNTTTETAWTYGGGGFSRTFAPPGWQAQIRPYKPHQLPAFRMVPDVALNADPETPWLVQFNGTLIGVGGTSCVAPAMAGLLGLWRPVLSSTNGFIAPLLYQRAAGFHDIVVGSNDDIPSLPLKYVAGPGFDLVTGLGSVNGTGL